MYKNFKTISFSCGLPQGTPYQMENNIDKSFAGCENLIAALLGS
jgi:hypothetical protein